MGSRVNDVCAFVSQYDANANGLLSASELRALLREMGAQVSDTQFALFQEEMDLNRDGRIGRGEFIHAVAANRRHLERAANPNQNYSTITASTPGAPQAGSNNSSMPSAGAVTASGAATGAGGSSTAAWQKVLSHLQQVPSAAAAIEALFDGLDTNRDG